jgi:hypothetical protein
MDEKEIEEALESEALRLGASEEFWRAQYGVWTLRGGRVVRVAWFEDRAEALEAAGLRE